MAKDSDNAGPVFVGIAASAGGLEACTALIKSLPDELNAVFVIAQHMAPQRESLLTALLDRETGLDVCELTEDLLVPQPNKIYVTPPNWDVIVTENGELTLKTPNEHPATPKPSADRLFISIAEYAGNDCVGIVLSGTGTDGSYGVQAIREHGGITIAQDPSSAKFDGMPATAISTGCIDLMLPASDVGVHLEKILQRTSTGELQRPKKPPVELHTELLTLLQSRTRIDFTEYKEQTLHRRVQRRMDTLGIDDFERYVEKCRHSGEELDILHRNFLISVTRFFRDPKQFQKLEIEINKLVERKASNQIRVWVAGCATGEEAYSVAILMAEALGGPECLERHNVQIFATDIDEQALEVARKGRYAITAAHDLPPHIIETYFQTGPNTLDVIPELRAVTLFSKHNVIQDPPFLNIDLATLRNVLIYFKPALQERVLSRFHYSLSPNGMIFLGTSEAIRSMDLCFEAAQTSDKIYFKRKSTRPESIIVPEFAQNTLNLPPVPERENVPVAPEQNTDTTMFDALARAVAPNGFVVTRKNDIVRVFGDVSPLLELNEASSLRLSVRILRPGLRDEAPGLISVAFKNKEFREGRWHQIDGHGFNQVKMICFPIIATVGEDHMLVAFRTRYQTDESKPVESLSDKERTQYILQIETEMQSTREALQQTVEELQTSNEELQSVNEELQSTNEELQATNEELETSNEELQSTNEELLTVNEEMQVNSSALRKVSQELEAVLKTSPHPILVVDNHFIVRRASDSALSFFQMEPIPHNGIHLGQLLSRENAPPLLALATEALKSGSRESVDLHIGKHLQSLVAAPFHEASNGFHGLTLSIFDHEDETTANLMQVIEQMSGIGAWRHALGTDRLQVSDDIRSLLGLGRGKVTIADLEAIAHPDDLPNVRDTIASALEYRSSFSFDVRCVKNDKRVLHAQVSGTVIKSDTGRPTSIVGAVRDATTILTNSLIMEHLEHAQQELGVGIFAYDLDNDETYLSGDAFRILDVPPQARTTQSIYIFLNAFQKSEQKKIQADLKALAKEGGSLNKTYKLFGKRGKKSLCRIDAKARTRSDGSVSHIYGSMRDGGADDA